jgi:hypothetical protein
MPQTTASDVQAPASSARTAAPSGVVGTTRAAPSTAPTAPIAPELAAFLRARRDALSNQLESVQGRRDDVAEKLRSDETQAVERPGLQDRLRVLDDRLIQIEQEIATNSEQLANAPADERSEGQTAVAPQPGFDTFISRVNPNAVTFLGFLLLLPIVVRLTRRFIAPVRGASTRDLAELSTLKERMEKLDGAVDAVAVEVERIGEGQRFLTQAMTENLQRNTQSLGAPVPAFEPVVVRQRDAIEQR